MTQRKKIKSTLDMQQWEALLARLRYEALIESVGASTRLAGSKLSNEEVEIILFRENARKKLQEKN